MLRISKDKDLARYVSDRTMTICTNVMTLANRPMNDSVYALHSDDRDGGMILMMNVTTPGPMGGSFAISSCRTMEDSIIVTTTTTMTSCTVTCTFKYDAAKRSYSFSERDYINEPISRTISAVDYSSKPILIRSYASMFNGDVDIQTP